MSGSAPERKRELRWHSLLFCPADQPQRIPKAIAAGPGGVIVDLEDAVHPSRRPQARLDAVAALEADRPRQVGHLIRVNPVGSDDLAADLAVVVGPWLDAVLLPKVSGPAAVVEVDERLSAAEAEVGSIGIVPVIEDCAALLETGAIARASRRVRAMSFAGAEAGDFMADLGGRWTADGMALHYPKSRFVCDVRAAGDIPVVDGPSMNLGEPAVWESESSISRTLGFDGKVAIHPRQLEAIHSVFLPTPEEVARAREVLDDLRQADADGRGVVRSGDLMVDTANGRAARRVLRRAGEFVADPPATVGD